MTLVHRHGDVATLAEYIFGGEPPGELRIECDFGSAHELFLFWSELYMLGAKQHNRLPADPPLASLDQLAPSTAPFLEARMTEALGVVPALEFVPDDPAVAEPDRFVIDATEPHPLNPLPHPAPSGALAMTLTDRRLGLRLAFSMAPDEAVSCHVLGR